MPYMVMQTDHNPASDVIVGFGMTSSQYTATIVGILAGGSLFV